MLKKLINGQINSITIAALLVGLSSLISRFLGIFRDRILAGQFGAGDTLDVYYAAFRIPDLIFNLLVLGALSAGFVPVFTSLINDPVAKLKRVFSIEANQTAWKLANNTINILALGLVVISLAGIVFAPFVVKLITPGFTDEKLAQTVIMSRIMFLSPIFLGISSVIGGCLQSFKRFFVYSLSPIFYNIGIIIGALFLIQPYGIYGLAWGVVLGAFLHLLVQIPSLSKLGFKYELFVDFKDEYVKKIAWLSLPRTMSLAINQLNLVIMTSIATLLASGSLAVFNLANNLQSFPVGIFGISYAVAAFPSFAANAFKKDKLIFLLSRTVRQVLFFIIPSTIIIYSLRAQIVRVILGTGNFTWQNTINTMDALSMFCLSLFAQALIPIMTRIFYSRQDSKTPFYIGIVSVAANIGLGLWLPRVIVCHPIISFLSWQNVTERCEIMGSSGLALAFSASTLLNFILLWVYLRKEMGACDEKIIIKSTIKFIIAASIAGLSIQAMKLLIWPFVDMQTFIGVLSQAGAAAIIGVAVYLGICALLQSEELFNFWESVKKRMPSHKIESQDQGEARGI